MQNVDKKEISSKESPTPLLKQLMKSKPQKPEKPSTSKYARYTVDMESFRDSMSALPAVYKFFWMIYRLSPMRTIIIIAVYVIQGLLPALRLRTGGNFIKQVQFFRLMLTSVATWNRVWNLKYEKIDQPRNNTSHYLCH